VPELKQKQQATTGGEAAGQRHSLHISMQQLQQPTAAAAAAAAAEV
jgi:hypothetical protein